jgi:hypothetical protein
MATLETRPQDHPAGGGDHNARILADHLTRTAQFVLIERAMRAGKRTIPHLDSEELYQAIAGDEDLAAEAGPLLEDLREAGSGPEDLQGMARDVFRSLRPPSLSPELLAAAEDVLNADERHRLARSALIGERADDLLFQLRMGETGQPARPDADREWRRRVVHPQTKFDLVYKRMQPAERRVFCKRLEARRSAARKLRP